MVLTLGFSPCPNDTFIFDAMVNGKIDTRGIGFDTVLADVETLNRWAEEGRLDITKLSYHAFLQQIRKYALLHAGSALGKGVGPLLIRNPQSPVRDLAEARVAIPGVHTTANLLFSLAHPEAKNKTELVFSEIEDAVLRGEYDAGLVIHESRFTYAQRGLQLIEDLGEWWERHAGAAIPLGGIVIRRGLDPKLCATVDAVIRDSLRYAWSQYPQLSAFVTGHAQEMDEAVMRQHIELYVNEYTEDLGLEGEQAIGELFRKASEAGLVDSQDIAQIFY